MREFPLASLYAVAGDGVFRRFIRVCAFIAQTQGLHFRTLLSLAFLFILYLHLCSVCSKLGFAVNVREFALASLCAFAGDGLIRRFVRVCAFIAQTQGLHFRTLHTLSLLLI